MSRWCYAVQALHSNIISSCTCSTLNMYFRHLQLIERQLAKTTLHNLIIQISLEDAAIQAAAAEALFSHKNQIWSWNIIKRENASYTIDVDSMNCTFKPNAHLLSNILKFAFIPKLHWMRCWISVTLRIWNDSI